MNPSVACKIRVEKAGSTSAKTRRRLCPGKHLFPLMLMQNGGGGSPEDLRQIRKDNGLCEEINRTCSVD